MKAIINKGRLLSLTLSDDGVEVGNIPKGVGLERLYWDGETLFDLYKLSSFWVDKDRNLYPDKDFGRQLVYMNYNERKNLTKDKDNMWVIKSEEEKQKQINEIRKQRKIIQAKRKLKRSCIDNSITTTIIKALINKDSSSINKLKDYLEEIE